MFAFITPLAKLIYTASLPYCLTMRDRLSAISSSASSQGYALEPALAARSCSAQGVREPVSMVYPLPDRSTA